MKLHGALAVVLASAMTMTTAQEKLNKNLPASKTGLVTIENVAGTVRVTGWDRAEVEVTGTLGKDSKEVVFTNSGDRTTIRVELPQNAKNVDGSDLVINVPRSSRVEINLVSSTATVTDLDGELRLDSVSGDVEVTGTIREAEVTTVSSTIRFQADGTLTKGLFKSVSGRIDVRASLDPSGRLRFETVSGPIELRLPKRTSAEFDVSTFSGDITNDFGETPTRLSEYLPSKELKFSLGSGGARVTVQTLSGSIHMRSE